MIDDASHSYFLGGPGRQALLRVLPLAFACPWRAAPEKKEDAGRWNKSLATLRREHEEAVRGGSGEKKNGLEAEASKPLIYYEIVGAAGRIRTHDPLVRSQVLYPTELQPRSAAV